MTGKPPSRTRFYRDKRNGKLLGVCAGIADYSGLDVTLIRILLVAAVLMTSFALVPLYLAIGWLVEDKPRELRTPDPEDQRFWQGVRASPALGAREIRSRLRDINRRLADLESYVTNRSLAREIDRLR